MSKIDTLREFLKENLECLEDDCSSGHNFDFPDFELLPMDYLEFADKELEQKNSRCLINAINYLKRAAECEIDTFLYVCNLYKFVDKNNLGFDAKLNFLKDVGIFNSRTLSRFNKIRNKIEHEYSIPEIEEIDVYYDLVSALVELLEGSMFMIGHGSELEFSIEKEDKVVGRFKIEYVYEDPSIRVMWEINEQTENISVNPKENQLEFTYFFKILMLLNKRSCLINNEYVSENL